MNVDEVKDQITTLTDNVADIINKEPPEEIFYTLESATFISSDEVQNQTRILNVLNTKQDTYSLRGDGAQITFVEPFYISTVGLEPTTDSDIEVEYDLLDGRKIKQNKSETNDYHRIVFSLNQICVRISIKAKAKFMRKKFEITDLRISHLSLDKLYNAAERYNKVSNDRELFTKRIDDQKKLLNQTLAKINTDKEAYLAEIAQKEDLKAQLETDTKDLENTKNDLESDISKKEHMQKSLHMESLSLKQAIDDNGRQLKNIKDDIDDKEKALLDLKKNINAFPDTLIGFTDRTYTQKRTFYFLSALPMVLFAVIIDFAINFAAGLVNDSTLKTIDQAEAILLQRLPFTVLFLGLATICISFIRKMVNQLTDVQQQELNLTKISILAKDIADSEFSDLSEDELQHRRTHLKLQLIQQYLASEFIRSEKLKDNKSERLSTFGSIGFQSLIPSILKLENKIKTEKD